MLYSLTQRFSLLVMFPLFFGCGGGDSAEPGAALEDPNACVPLEERTDCFVDGEEEISTNLASQMDIDKICQSTCRRVKGIWIGGDVEDLSVLEFLDIDTLERSIHISSPRLTSLKGLEQVRKTFGVRITDNPNLTSLEGLHNLEVAEGGVKISSNQALESLEGLRSLRVANNTTGLSISYNDNLENLEGLESLEEVFNLYISDQPQIRDLEPLRNVKTIEWLRLSKLDNLSSIEALAPENETWQVGFLDNPMLPECQIDAYLERVGIDKETKKSSHLMLFRNGSSDPAACSWN